MANILVVDDNSDLLELTRKILAAEGHEVWVAADGNKATHSISEQLFDLVITDIIMPGKEGIELIMELQRDKPGLPIIAMSGGGRIDAADYLRMAGRLGVMNTLAKPYSKKQLLEVVNRALEMDISSSSGV